VISLPVQAQMYKWVDEQGNVHFTDKAPNQEAKEYQPPPIMVMPAGPTGNFSPSKQPKSFKYQSLSVTAPQNDAVFTPDKADSVQVNLEITPALNGQHNIALYLDGELHTVAKQPSFNLTGLPRGTHTVFASVLDKENKKLITSNSVSFHIQRHHR
jgi:hypothetical protein